MTKKANLVVLVLGAICKKGGVFKYTKIFQGDNGSEFKNDVTKLLKKYNAEMKTIAYSLLAYSHSHCGGL